MLQTAFCVRLALIAGPAAGRSWNTWGRQCLRPRNARAAGAIQELNQVVAVDRVIGVPVQAAAQVAVDYARDHGSGGSGVAQLKRGKVGHVDIAVGVVPNLEVLFLDTQYHFAETLWYVEEVRKRYELNLTIVKPLVRPDNLWQRDIDACCEARKVEPLRRAVAGRPAWMSGARRHEAITRSRTPVVRWDAARRIVQVNPIATWTEHDVAGYIRDHQLPVHPLATKGYPSIGCWPCTSPVAPGEDPRAGRWRGTGKLECGINE